MGYSDAEAYALVRQEREAADVGNGSIEGDGRRNSLLSSVQPYVTRRATSSDLDSQTSHRDAEQDANAAHEMAPDVWAVEEESESVA